MRTKSEVIVIYRAGFNATFDSVEECAKALNLSVASVYLYINSGKECKDRECFIDLLYTEADAAEDCKKRLEQKSVTVDEVFSKFKALAEKAGKELAEEKTEAYKKIIKLRLDRKESVEDILHFFSVLVL